MIAPKLPEREAERLNALYYLNILDTEAEERFDRITRIACKLFDVPIASICFVDKDRLWFKSSQGLDITETPRDISFSAYAILHDEVMVIEDATLDERFHDNPLVIEKPYVKFYLGCPLKIKSQNVGALCLIDTKPRCFNEEQIKLVQDLREMVLHELESLNLSTIDYLTGLSNRRGFLKIAHHILKLCQREKRDLSLLYFNLNKSSGYQINDEALKIFAHILLRNFRSSDVIARLGDKGFCVLCSGLKSNDIEAAVTRFGESLRADYDKEHPIQYSFGSLQYNEEEHKSIYELLAHTDEKIKRLETDRPELY